MTTRLRPGDQLRVVTPAGSLDGVPAEVRSTAVRRLVDELGLVVTFGGHVDEGGPLGTGSIAGRVTDLHAAFADPDVAGVLAVHGSRSPGADLSLQLLPHLDWSLLAGNPRVLCAPPTLSALVLTVSAASGQVGYLTPEPGVLVAGSAAAQASVAEFRRCLLTDDPIRWEPGESDPGWWLVQPGSAAGRLVAGDLGTLALLRAVGRLPELHRSVLMVRPAANGAAADFQRDLSVLLQPGPDGHQGLRPAGLVIGAFPESAGMSRSALAHAVATTPELAGAPVLANVEFGPERPGHTVPIGAECWLAADPGAIEIILSRH
jgi:muramoyltetrapeptide carboxypeptidase LdcA involved in peptidoglycan recycling